MPSKLLRRRLRTPLLAVLSLSLFSAIPSTAALITDPAGDFLPSFTGPHNGDLDVLSAQVFFNGSDFRFTSTLNGAIGTTPSAIYVWGVDRGAGMHGFPTIAPGVTFDSVFVISPSGSSAVHDLINGANTPISGITVSGDTLSATVPLSALPSEGFAPSAYLVNLWPRSSNGGNNVIADFAPDNSDAAVTPTPEPGTLPLVAMVAFAALALMRRRTHSAV